MSYHLSSDGLETDFVCRGDALEEVQLIQVCWSVRDEKTLAREVRSLKSAMSELKIDKGLIVTWMEEVNLGGGITAMPFWKWAIQKDLSL